MTSRLLQLDWQVIRDKVNRQVWAGKLAETLAQSFAEAQTLLPAEPPTLPSAWFHYYFCQKCSVALHFDPTQSERHECPNCRNVYEGEPYNGVWRKIVHGEIIANLERAVLLAHLQADSKPYSAYLRKTILFYSEHYADYAVHGDHAGKGKIMPQCLTEAIFVISFGFILQLTEDLNIFSQDELSKIGSNFFRPAAELLLPQITHIHNIHAWMDAAVYVAGYFLKDSYLQDIAMNGPFGWFNQLEKGTDQDGFWHEGSITYHFYTAQALSSLAVFHPNPEELFHHERMQKMLQAPLRLAYHDIFPSYNDCWRFGRLSGYANLYELFVQGCPQAGFDHALASMYPKQKMPTGAGLFTCTPCLLKFGGTHQPRQSTAALLWGPEALPPYRQETPANVLYRHAGIGILQNESVRVALRFGPYGGGHDHLDKLGIDFCAAGQEISADLGTSGYGTDLCNRWYRTSAAHNIVIMNSGRQQPSDGSLVDWTANSVTAEAKGAYADATLRRTITLMPLGWRDVFTAASSSEQQWDWCFHCQGDIATALSMAACSAFTQNNGYDQVSDLTHLETSGDWTITWNNAYGQLRLTMAGIPGTQIFLGRCPDNPSSQTLGIVIVRRHSRQTVFDADFLWLAQKQQIKK